MVCAVKKKNTFLLARIRWESAINLTVRESLTGEATVS